ncbi:hypothetical protein K437DRAFT_276347 [Tilletiaria anomala UBC 951]|uniref:RRM domain-containing protein n=1 Tax=Tilletiaria anomala (strain ATCC 24038 / CBS 436.72 / UBC 951) TaxID=1037660 RepID=A0A066V8Y1_TILAU|nr:uncharacterized protein K437DRAFT_276347 [Tilletiaria anomala UBC 951]KDN38202.1 hypothetical protein K437DRAFT_276347 [Tilletiaria anomala UBC 951]
MGKKNRASAAQAAAKAPASSSSEGKAIMPASQPTVDEPAKKKQKKQISSPSSSGGKAKETGPAHPLPCTIGQFTAVPLRLPSKFIKSTPYHWIYIRAHASSESAPTSSAGPGSSKTAELPAERTLFVANLPVEATERHLRALFQPAGGRVQRVIFQAAKNLYEREELRRRSLLPSSGSDGADGVEEEEDEYEDVDDGEDEMPDASTAEVHSVMKAKNKQAQKGSKKNSKSISNALLSSIPSITALPSMDPRVASNPSSSASSKEASIPVPPLLPTGSSAHVIFLDASTLTRAVQLAKEGALTPRGWANPDPFADLALAETEASARIPRGGVHAGTAAGSDTTGNANAGAGVGANMTANGKVDAAARAAFAAGARAPPLGLAYLLAAHDLARPSLGAVRTYADSCIARYEYLRAHPAAAAAADAANGGGPGKGEQTKGGIEAVSVGPDGELLDADGFVIVQHGGKYGRANAGQGQGVGVIRKYASASAPGSDMAQTQLGQEQKRQKKKRALELDDFYKFQRREKKRDELAEMRARFEADKEKVRKLREGRRFKPY